ncbi:MAG: hypothetical protein V2A79_07495 [Planctomycetota bacterium]
MRRSVLLMGAALLACANIGCLAVVSNETLAASSRRVAVVDGQMYVIDLQNNTAKRVRLVPEGEVSIELPSETEPETTASEVPL